MVDDAFLQTLIHVKQPIQHGQRFLTSDVLKYAAKEWLKEHSELYSEITVNCMLTETVILIITIIIFIMP